MPLSFFILVLIMIEEVEHGNPYIIFMIMTIFLEKRCLILYNMLTKISYMRALE